MYYYQFNIGDYQSHTSHLSDIEDLAYRRLLDWYYLHESPIPDDIPEIARQIRMRSHTESIAIVLGEFFELTKKGWVSVRANREIARADEKSAKASASAKARWNKTSNANALPTQSESNATHNTRHKTQDTKPNKKTTDVVMPEGISQSVWDEFIAHRKAKKAKVTQLVIESIGKEASKAGWSLEDALKETIVRNWQSFKADWVQPKQASNSGFIGKPDVAHMTTPTPKNHDAALRKIEEDSKKAVPIPANIREKMAALLGDKK